MQRTTPLILAGLMACGAALAAETIDFNSYDSNSDGYLTESEWSDANQANIEFDTIDTNRDGYLDEAEVEAGMSADTQSASGSQAAEDDYSPTGYDPTAQDQAASEQQTGEPTGSETDATGTATGETTGSTTISTTAGEGQERDVSLYDTDSDGRVSRGEAEVDGELVTSFVVWDTNQDGYLDQDELESGDQQTDTSGMSSGEVERDQRVTTEGEDTAGAVEETSATGSTAGSEETTGTTSGTEDTAGSTSGGEDTGYSTSGVSASGTSMENDTGTAGQFSTLDANSDGLLDETEAAEDDYINANFDAWDTDRDGFVSEDEASTGWTDGGNPMQEQRR